jgi:hypothetical protein
MNAYLQRADDFILQQMYRFEQKKQGRDYREMHNLPHRNHQSKTRRQKALLRHEDGYRNTTLNLNVGTTSIVRQAVRSGNRHLPHGVISTH